MAPDPALEEGLAELSQFFVGDATMIDTLHRVAARAVEVVEAADYCSLTMVIDGGIRTGAFTHPHAPEVDQVQYDVDDGPCLDALRKGEIFRINSMLNDGPWPAFRQACRKYGIMTAASFPMLIDGTVHGALNMYSQDYHAFGAQDIRQCRSFATQAGTVIANARSYWSARQLSENLEHALHHRAEIEQAKGIIVATTGATPDAAFEALVQQSRRQNRDLREVARDLITSTVRRVASREVEAPQPSR